MGFLDKIFGKKENNGWKEPKCGVCGLDTAGVVKSHPNPNAYAIGNLVGICPVCKKVYCIRCAKESGPNFLDYERCPIHDVDLDFHWDEEPSEDKPWRIGPKPEDIKK